MIVKSGLVEKGDGYIKCNVCRRRCIIKEGETGFCDIRKNVGGELDLIVYGKPAALNVDPIEKKPLFHFLPGTNAFSLGTYGCTFRCKFCQNWELAHAFREGIPTDFYYDLPPEKAVQLAKAYNSKVMAYTYNEPVIWYEYWRDISKLAVKEGLKNVLVTDGYGTPELWEDAKEYIHAANIDLKGFTRKFYGQYTGAILDYVLDSIKLAKKLGIWVEVTTLVIPGVNDDRDNLREAAEWLKDIDPEMPWHITAFHPDYKMRDVPPTDKSELIRIREMALDVGLKYVYVGNVISPFEHTYCPNCGELVIERVGYQVRLPENFNGRCPKCNHKIKGVWNS